MLLKELEVKFCVLDSCRVDIITYLEGCLTVYLPHEIK